MCPRPSRLLVGAVSWVRAAASGWQASRRPLNCAVRTPPAEPVLLGPPSWPAGRRAPSLQLAGSMRLDPFYAFGDEPHFETPGTANEVPNLGIPGTAETIRKTNEPSLED
jgi:hypothetical protein